MKILVVEYVTGGGLREEAIPPSLCREGKLMLDALAEDLLAAPGVELIVFHDDRLAALQNPRIQNVSIANSAVFATAWRDYLARCDAAWPIAPETGGILQRLCVDVEAANKTLLTSPATAVQLTASKLATLRRLDRHGLPVVPTVPLADFALLDSTALVVKPDDGAGCEGSQIIYAPNPLPAGPANLIVQPLIHGEHLSLSALFNQGQARLLSCNRQCVAQDGAGFVLQACQVNAVADTDGRWQALAGQIARAVPELWGYAGIDFILTIDGPMLLEINPRLTTSYVGLRLATGENPAALLLALLASGRLPAPRSLPTRQIDITLN